MAENKVETAEGSKGGVEFTPSDYEYSALMRLLGVSVSKHLLDEHFTLVWANEFYYDLIGWPKEEYEERFHNRPDLYYAEDQKEWKELETVVMEALGKKQSGYKLVSRFRRKNGDYIWVQFSATFADEYIGGYQVAYSTLTNIDHIVRMQKEQMVTYESLPGFVAKYQVVITDGRMSFDLLEANSRFMEYFDEVDEYGGRPLYQQNIWDNQAVIEEQYSRILAGEPLHFVMRVQSREGNLLWLQVNATCVDWKGGYPIYLTIFIDITDVTELRKMQKQLTEQTVALTDALAVAERANRAKADFLSRMSHEIRTPMNAIIGMTTIAGAYLDDRSRVQDCLTKIGYSSKHLMSLINDILDMSKIEEGKMQIACEPFNLVTVIESVTSIIYPQAEEKGVVFTVPLVDIDATVLTGDNLRLNQILINLLTNAVKFTPRGGSVRLEIQQTRRTSEKVSLRFIISDTGIGMSRDFLKRVFQPFEQESAATGLQYGGTGLGMAITKNLVTLMGGVISVDSEPDKGSAFTVDLSFAVPAEENSSQPRHQPALESLKVLVSDDDRDSCVHATLMLKKLGIVSDWAETGEDCIRKVQNAYKMGENYDVCFIDWKMPDLDGVEVTRRIRNLIGPDTTIIIITAYDWSFIEKSARAAGANAFLAKPIFASTLYNTLLSVTDAGKNITVSEPDVRLRHEELEGKHVLLAEDNELNREIATELLGLTGVIADCARNGKEALEKFLAHGDDYDLILMDVQMPVMDGYQAAEAIRGCGHPRAGTIPIIAMTADAFHEDVLRAMNAGMDGHLAKPIDPALFYSTLAEFIAKK